MGMYSLNIRLLPTDCTVTVKKDKDGVMFWDINGNSNMNKKELLQKLSDGNIDIMVKKNDIYKESYLINKGIEMLIQTDENEKINIINLKICLCFLCDGLKECYDFAYSVNKIMSVKYWITNEYGSGIRDREIFIKEHMEFVKKKYDIFRESFGNINIRLTEEEFYINSKKKISPKRRLKEYIKLSP